MKGRLLLLLILLMTSALVRGADGYICSSAGTVLEYVRRNADDGSVRWRHTMTIENVICHADSSLTVHYKSDFRKADGKQMYGGAVRLQSDVNTRGDVSMELAQTLKSVFANMFPKMKLSVDGGMAEVPAILTAGEGLPSVSASASVAGIRYTMAVSERSVVGCDTLVTPAGEFPCVVVFEHKEEKAVGYNRVTSSRTWYCKGIGMVRHDTYDRKMHLETSEVLERINNRKSLK